MRRRKNPLAAEALRRATKIAMEQFLKTWKPSTGQLHLYIKRDGRGEVLWQHPCRVVRVATERVVIVTTDEVCTPYECKVKPDNLRLCDPTVHRGYLKAEVLEPIAAFRARGER